MINWKVRLKNKTFWASIIPALFILIQTVAALFGYSLNLMETQGKLLAVVDAVFALLAAAGVVIDHTTVGVGDSARAMTYDEPSKGD